MADIMAAIDYVVAEVITDVGHSRVYNRTRGSRKRAQFETLFTDSGGLAFWTVKRPDSADRHMGASHRTNRTHSIEIIGTYAAKDEAVEGNAPEVALQMALDSLVERFRIDPNLGGNSDLAGPASLTIQELEYAGVACHIGRLTLSSVEYLAFA